MNKTTKRQIVKMYGWLLPPGHYYSYQQLADEIINKLQAGTYFLGPTEAATYLANLPNPDERFFLPYMFDGKPQATKNC